MPIYEYECRACGHRFEQLILHASTPECPSCQSHDLERLISLFAVDSESTRGLASDAGRYIAGTTIVVDGGQMVGLRGSG